MAVPVLLQQLLLVYCRSGIPVAGNSAPQPQHLLHTPWRSLRFPHSWKARWEQQAEPEAEGEVVPDPRCGRRRWERKWLGADSERRKQSGLKLCLGFGIVLKLH